MALGERRAILFFLSIALVLLTAPSVSSYIGVSGDFYAHTYRIPLGGSVSGSTILIENPSNETIHVRMIYQIVPHTDFLRVSFSASEFFLPPGKSKLVYITLSALPNCPPGNYTVIVGGEEILKSGNESIAVPSGALKAKVVVTGASAVVLVRTLSVTGTPVPTHLIILALPSGYQVKDSNTGIIRAVVAPGEYRVEAYLAGHLLNSTTFRVSANQNKNVTLVVRTVYFLAFDVAPAKNSRGEIGYAYMVSTVRNLFKPLKDAKLILTVKYNGKPLENVSVATIPVLPLNDTEFKYNYIPSNGWKAGTYTFQMKLYSGKILYAETNEVSLQVTPEMVGQQPTASATSKGKQRGTPGVQYLAVGVAVLAALALVVLALRRRSPVQVVDVKVAEKGLEVYVENGGKKDAMLLNVRVLALPSKVEIASIKRPKTIEGMTKVKAGSRAEILIPDEDGSIVEAYEGGGVIIRVETNVGIAERKVSP